MNILPCELLKVVFSIVSIDIVWNCIANVSFHACIICCEALWAAYLVWKVLYKSVYYYKCVLRQYTTIERFGVSNIFNILKKVSYAHQGCILLINMAKTNIVKYYFIIFD